MSNDGEWHSWIVIGGSVVTFILFFFVVISSDTLWGILGDIIELCMCIIYLIMFFIAIVAFASFFGSHDRSETTFNDGDVFDEETLDIYNPAESGDTALPSSLARWHLVEKANVLQTKGDSVTKIHTIEEVGEYAECPYCGFNSFIPKVTTDRGAPYIIPSAGVH